MCKIVKITHCGIVIMYCCWITNMAYICSTVRNHLVHKSNDDVNDLLTSKQHSQTNGNVCLCKRPL